MKQITKTALTALASEKALAKDWSSKEEDEAWKSLRKKKNSKSIR